MPVTKVCEVCCKEFQVPPVRAATATTCSRVCRGKQTAAKYEADRAHLICECCGKAFSVPRCHEGLRKHCSKACHARSQIGVAFTEKVENGSRWLSPTGYVLVVTHGHPFGHRRTEQVFEHRLVLEERMRREAPGHPFLVEIDGVEYLRLEIHVHHRNEIKDDNSERNLIACTQAAHKALHKGGDILAGETWPEVSVALPEGGRWITACCVRCGKEMKQSRSEMRRGRKPYCSVACSDAHPSGLPGEVERECQCCGKKFVVRRHKVLEGGGKYCSLACRSKTFTGKPQSSWKQLTGPG